MQIESKQLALDALWKLYNEHRTHCRHYELQRSTLSATLAAIVAAMIGIITFDRSLNLLDAPLAALVIVVAVLGGLFSIKLTERATLESAKAAGCLTSVDRLLSGGRLARAESEGQENYKSWAKKRFQKLLLDLGSWMRVQHLWLTLYVFMAVVGIALMVIALLWPGATPTDSSTGAVTSTSSVAPH